MEVHTEYTNNNFQALSRHEPVVLDNTAIMTFKTCPRKYFFQLVLGFRETEKQPYFAFGSAYHKYREILDITWIQLKDDNSLSNNEKFEICNLSAQNKALKVWLKDYPNDPGVEHKYGFLTKNRLLLSAKVALEWWKKERLGGAIEVLNTEQFFTLVLPDGSVIGGRSDRIILWNTRVWGQDYKTGAKQPKWFSYNLKPSHQFILYTYGESELHGKRLRGQMVEYLYNDKKNGPEIHPFPVEFTESQILWWLKDVMYWISLIKQARETDHYGMNEASCNRCPFLRVCKEYSENGMIATLKSNNYIHAPWDCSKVGDLGDD